MDEIDALDRQLARLNPEQRDAVDTIDGPLLVIAGPGTGKTQILSLRAANILRSRDVEPENILCLTYTDAGAEAMAKRLVELIGRDAYGIEVATFHSFASGLLSRYPEYFDRKASTALITELGRRRFIEHFLDELSPESALFTQRFRDTYSTAEHVAGFISSVKRSGLTPDELRAIARQTLAALDYLEESTTLLALADAPLKGSRAAKEELIGAFETEVARAASLAERSLCTPVVKTPGVYTPYIPWLRDAVAETEMFDGAKTSGFRDLKAMLFANDGDAKVFKDRALAKKLLVIADFYERYEAYLRAEDFCDYDDMILDAIRAIEGSRTLQRTLQERYRYIQVDEFQDTNGSQMRLVELLCEGIQCPNVMAVGDDDQAIMRFQGASVAGIEQFRELLHPKNVVLQINYRSTPSLVALGQDVAVQIENRLPESAASKQLRAFRDADDQTEFHCDLYVEPAVEYYELARDIRAKLDEGFIEACDDPDEAIAVIAPKHQSLRNLIPYLRHFSIPYTYVESMNVFTMESMQTLLALLRAVVALARGDESRLEASIPQILSAPELGLDHRACVDFALFAHRDHQGHWFEAMGECVHAPVATLAQHMTDWAARAAGAPLRELLFEIAEPLIAYYRAREEDNPLAVAEFNSGIRALLAFAQGEIEAAGKGDRALRLPDFLDTIEAARTFDLKIDASLTFGREGAVRLTTAHGSKGLEFDLVYLLDSDNDTWHRSGATTNYCPNNVYLKTVKDDDDVRRLLFVALTRAKRLLSISRAKGSLVKELEELVATTEREVEADGLAEIIEVDWRQAYALDFPNLRELLAPDLNRPLSASALNDFVNYEPGCVNSREFPSRRMVRLPEPPVVNMEFGKIVHGFFQDYVNHVRSGALTFEELVTTYRAKVLWMDFSGDVNANHANRFDRIARCAPAVLDALLDGRHETEVELEAVLESGVPLVGYSDLLLIDEGKREIRILDYKTGFNYPEGKPDANYERQLQFYTLLIEATPRFSGYRVVRADDFYVEPERGSDERLHPLVAYYPRREDLDHLKLLIEAVWRRIQACDFDTSGFESSDELEQALAERRAQGDRTRNLANSPVVQRAYEDWLIAHPTR